MTSRNIPKKRHSQTEVWTPGQNDPWKQFSVSRTADFLAKGDIKKLTSSLSPKPCLLVNSSSILALHVYNAVACKKLFYVL